MHFFCLFFFFFLFSFLLRDCHLTGSKTSQPHPAGKKRLPCNTILSYQKESLDYVHHEVSRKRIYVLTQLTWFVCVAVGKTEGYTSPKLLVHQDASYCSNFSLRSFVSCHSYAGESSKLCHKTDPVLIALRSTVSFHSLEDPVALHFTINRLSMNTTCT